MYCGRCSSPPLQRMLEISRESQLGLGGMRLSAMGGDVTAISTHPEWSALQRARTVNAAVVSPASCLAAEPDAVVRVGDYVDGLPLFVRIRRGVEIVQPLMSVLRAGLCLGNTPKDTLPPPISEALTTLDKTVKAAASSLKIVTLPGTEKQVYQSTRCLYELIGRTLMVQMLGPTSPTASKQKSSSRSRINTSACFSSTFSSKESISSAMQKVACDNYLAIPLDGTPPVNFRKSCDKVQPSRGIVWESLLGFENVSYSVPAANDLGERILDPEIKGSLATGFPQLIAALDRLASPSCTYSVPKQSIIKRIAQLGMALQKFHDNGIIHGDINPSNLLIGKTEVIPLDPLSIPCGTIAQAGTPGWCPNEQLLHEPVQPCSDVYPMGLLLAKVLGATIYGEQRKYIIPTNSGNSKVSVFHNPGVLINLTTTSMSTEACAAWRSFLERCLSSDMSKRPASGKVFAQQLTDLYTEHTVPGEYNQSLQIGTLGRVMIEGHHQIAHLVDD
ncbi:protein kinase [Pelomyxa schiedti]|nr:protein kinase [Pelomyxa schiedti]